jgi:hypothetical protein
MTHNLQTPDLTITRGKGKFVAPCLKRYNADEAAVRYSFLNGRFVADSHFKANHLSIKPYCLVPAQELAHSGEFSNAKTPY